MAKQAGKYWPKRYGEIEVSTQTDPITGRQMCKLCWNGFHEREGCREPNCECGCYRGKQCGLRGPKNPAKGVLEPDSLCVGVESIKIG